MLYQAVLCLRTLSSTKNKAPWPIYLRRQYKDICEGTQSQEYQVK